MQGKSLSIICGALTWLIAHENRERYELETTIDTLNKSKNITSSADWLTIQAEEIEVRKKLQKVQLEVNKIKKYDEKIVKIKSRKKDITKTNWFNKVDNETKEDKKEVDESENKDDLDFLIEETEEINSDESESEEEDKYESTKVCIFFK